LAIRNGWVGWSRGELREKKRKGMEWKGNKENRSSFFFKLSSGQKEPSRVFFEIFFVPFRPAKSN